MADRARPQRASVTIRRLTLPPGETGRGLSEAIAAAMARELGASDPAAAAESGVARAIARSITDHPEFVGAGPGRTSHGGR